MDWNTVALMIIGAQFLAVTAQILKDGKGRMPAVFTFGDSIVDTGNNNVLPTMTRCDFPPYGKDFADHRPSGRFSNGRVPSDLIASALGVKEFLPPYLTTSEDDGELLTGVSFASGGTGYDLMTARLAGVLAMADQLNLFREYKSRLASAAGEEKARMIVSNGLYILCGGSNDVINTMLISPIRRAQYNASAYVSMLASSASAVVQELHKLGARKIGVVGLPPLGCLPTLRTLAGDARRSCSQPHNQAAILYNSKLSIEIRRLARDLPDSRIIYIDIYTPLLDIIQRPSAYGFLEASMGCCGSGLLEMSMLCNSLSASTCSDDAKYVFWDSVHPTQRTYEIMVEKLMEKFLQLLL